MDKMVNSVWNLHVLVWLSSQLAETTGFTCPKALINACFITDVVCKEQQQGKEPIRHFAPLQAPACSAGISGRAPDQATPASASALSSAFSTLAAPSPTEASSSDSCFTFTSYVSILSPSCSTTSWARQHPLPDKADNRVLVSVNTPAHLFGVHATDRSSGNFCKRRCTVACRHGPGNHELPAVAMAPYKHVNVRESRVPDV